MIITRDMLSARCVLFVCLIFLMPHAAHSQTVEKRELCGMLHGPGAAEPIKRETADRVMTIPIDSSAFRGKRIADNLEPAGRAPGAGRRTLREN